MKAKFKHGPVWGGRFMIILRGIPVYLKPGDVIDGAEASEALLRYPLDFDVAKEDAATKEQALENEHNRAVPIGAYARRG